MKTESKKIALVNWERWSNGRCVHWGNSSVRYSNGDRATLAETIRADVCEGRPWLPSEIRIVGVFPV